MTNSGAAIDQRQALWRNQVRLDPARPSYAATYQENLFLKGLHPETEAEFRNGDGGELIDRQRRPAKMRALASSSALAVNCFDAWRNADKGALSRALHLPSPIVELSFEYKPSNYPVSPRSPNLDLMLRLADGRRIGLESKFSEPYRSGDGFGALSARYFPQDKQLWSEARLPSAQRVADHLKPDYVHLDVPQLLKHLLGLASDPSKPLALLYLWFDTGEPDAEAHRREIERFASEVVHDAVTFEARTYQEVFSALSRNQEPVEGWYGYMAQRYFE